MARIGFQRSFYELDFKVKVDFYFRTSHAYSVSQMKFEKMFPKLDISDISTEKNLRESKFGYLIIDSTFELNSYDSLNQGSARIRPDIIIVHGILSFFTNEPFLPAMSFGSHLNIVSENITEEGGKAIVICHNINLSVDFGKILKEIKAADVSKKILIYTILERWRKALYLEKESEDNYIYVDESVLAYMHVLEVLADEFKTELVKRADKLKEETSRKIIKIAQSEMPNQQEIKKLLNNYENIKNSLKEKIFQMLISFNLDNLKTRLIVERFVGHRNAIAHGRKNLFQERLIFPLPQFFSFIKDIDEDVEGIKILAARCISKLLNLNLWKEEWDFKLRCEIIPFKLVEEFIERKEYTKYKDDDFFNYDESHITPYSLAFYYKKGKLNFRDLEFALEKVISSCRTQKGMYQQLFEAAVILSDSNRNKLANKCKRIVSVGYQRQWYYHSNIRDIIKDYEYHDKKLIWFESWLKNGKNV